MVHLWAPSKISICQRLHLNQAQRSKTQSTDSLQIWQQHLSSSIIVKFYSTSEAAPVMQLQRQHVGFWDHQQRVPIDWP